MKCSVKICGITRYEDAVAALDAGADALGFVLAPGGREVQPAEVRRIVSQLPPFVSCVGVFVDASAAAMRELRDYCHLDRLQLQGSESPALCGELGAGVIKGFKVDTRVDMADVQRYPVSAWLFDAYVPGKAGGTGQCFAWDLLQGHAFSRPVILAGGLHPGNVRQAVLAARPCAVDVSSGVEQAARKKDKRKMRDFVEQAKSIELDALPTAGLSLNAPRLKLDSPPETERVAKHEHSYK